MVLNTNFLCLLPTMPIITFFFFFLLYNITKEKDAFKVYKEIKRAIIERELHIYTKICNIILSYHVHVQLVCKPSTDLKQMHMWKEAQNTYLNHKK